MAEGNLKTFTLFLSSRRACLRNCQIARNCESTPLLLLGQFLHAYSEIQSSSRTLREKLPCYTVAVKSLRTLPKLSWMLAIASGVLQVIIFPKLGWALLSWICLAPLLYALLNPPRIEVLLATETLAADSAPALTVVQGFCLGYFCGIVCYAGSCYWIYRTMRLYGGLSVWVLAGRPFFFSPF